MANGGNGVLESDRKGNLLALITSVAEALIFSYSVSHIIMSMS